MFFRKHKLYDGYGRFTADYDMAVAWERLRQGKALPRDRTLLYHELLESQLEREYNMSAADAHAIAQETYNWEKQLYEETGGQVEEVWYNMLKELGMSIEKR